MRCTRERDNIAKKEEATLQNINPSHMAMIEAKSCGRIEETVCNDMISELPEDLLVKILDLVPTKDAVTTMFLSKRWNSIWTMKLKLAYKDSDADSDAVSDCKKKSVWGFLDKSLQLHKSPVIESLCIELGPQCPTDADVGKWVDSAVDRCVLVLTLKLRWSAEPTRLPKSLYTCETLVELTLSHKILVDFPSSSSSCLQSLRLLDLYCVVYKDEETLLRFLSSCPILEIIFVEREKDDNVKRFTVKNHSLRCLFYRNDIYNDVGDTGRCLVIDTPALERLRILDLSGDDYSIDRMPCLDDAFISTVFYIPDDRFLKSISSVLSLKFGSSHLLLCSSATYFSRLTKLKICPQKSDWMENLVVFLRNSPKLESLKVDCILWDMDSPPSWNEPSSIPECLSSNLEIFTWEGYGGREEEEQFLTYILANAKCLKTARITVSLEEQQKMMEKLKDIPRVSTTSQLLFK